MQALSGKVSFAIHSMYADASAMYTMLYTQHMNDVISWMWPTPEIVGIKYVRKCEERIRDT